MSFKYLNFLASYIKFFILELFLSGIKKMDHSNISVFIKSIIYSKQLFSLHCGRPPARRFPSGCFPMNRTASTWPSWWTGRSATLNGIAFQRAVLMVVRIPSPEVVKGYVNCEGALPDQSCHSSLFLGLVRSVSLDRIFYRSPQKGCFAHPPYVRENGGLTSGQSGEYKGSTIGQGKGRGKDRPTSLEDNLANTRGKPLY